MALSVYKGTISQKTSTGSQGYTGIGFQPKALLLFGGLLTANGTTPHATHSMGFVASSSDRRYSCYVDKDNVTVTVARRRWSNDKAFGIIDNAGTVLCECDLTSFDSDGFTLNWGTADATARIIHVIAIGGTNVTNVKGGEQTRRTSTGSQAVTGIGFQPTVGFFMSNDASTTGNATDAHYSFGFAANSTNEGVCMAQSAHDLGDSEASRYLSDTATIGSHNTSSGSGLRALADFTSFDSDGYTLNWSTVNANAYYYAYLLIKGDFKADVLSWTKITTTGDDAKTGVGFTPKLIIHQGHQNTSTGSSTQARHSLGAATGTSNYGTVAFASQTAAATSRTDCDHRTDSTLDFMTEGAPTTPTINDRATHVAFGTDGFTINWGTSSASARRVLTLSIGGETQTIAPTGLSSAEAIGSHTIATAGGGTQTITCTALASAEAFGTAKFGHYLLPSAIASATAFGTAVLTPGVVTLLPSAITTAEAFGTAKLGHYLLPSAIATAEAFGTAVIAPGTAYILPSGIATAAAFGTAVLTPGVVYILPTGITSGETIGSATVVPGARTLSPSAITSAEAFGTASLGFIIYPSAIGTGAAFGTAVLTPGTAYILPTGIASATAFGTAVITPGVAYILPSGIATAEAFGTHAITNGVQFLIPTGITTGEAFGTHTVTPGVAYILPSAITTANTFGTAVLVPGAVIITPSGITTGETFGTHTVTPGAVTLLPSGITTGETFGTASLGFILYPSAITTGEAFGTHTVTPGTAYILPGGIATAEAFGTLWIATAAGVPFIILHAVQRTEPYTAGTRRFLLNASARRVEFKAFERVFVFHARKTQDFE